VSLARLLDRRDLAAALAAWRFLLLEHSPRCEISVRALAELERFHARRSDVPVAWLDVIAERELAREVAAHTSIAHASPQAILFARGRALWSASHGAITADALEAACAQPGV
jgi:bacillithiol system protein YtxJ